PHAPTLGGYYLTVERFHTDATYVHQTATSFGAGNTANKVYSRCRVNSVWGAWSELATTYKKYVALITQSGGTFTNANITVQENSIGSIVWSYLGAGTYMGVLSGAFPNGKTIVLTTNGRTAGTINGYGDTDNNTIYLK